jgi:hypothetical protein
LPQKTLTFAFLNIGEYRLFIQRTHPISGNQERLSFHCAIRNSEELLTERIELHEGEELFTEMEQIQTPLLKIDQLGAWGYMPQQQLWWPLRQHFPILALDRSGNVRLKWET